MELEQLPHGKTVILFDGVCNFCNDYVNKVISLDKKDQFVFASIQSEIGQKIIKHIGLPSHTDSIIYYKPGYAYYIESDAVFAIIDNLSTWMSWIWIFKIFPKSLRDSMYRYFAKNRYKWFGKREECMMPTPAIKKKFLLVVFDDYFRNKFTKHRTFLIFLLIKFKAMQISYNSLKQFIKLDMTPEETANVLTDLGLEVEGLNLFESLKGSLKGVVVGHVLSCEQHPNADKLKITKVDLGNGEAPVQIVCGAPNVAA